MESLGPAGISSRGPEAEPRTESIGPFLLVGPLPRMGSGEGGHHVTWLGLPWGGRTGALGRELSWGHCEQSRSRSSSLRVAPRALPGPAKCGENRPGSSRSSELVPCLSAQRGRWCSCLSECWHGHEEKRVWAGFLHLPQESSDDTQAALANPGPAVYGKGSLKGNTWTLLLPESSQLGLQSVSVRFTSLSKSWAPRAGGQQGGGWPCARQVGAESKGDSLAQRWGLGQGSQPAVLHQERTGGTSAHR